MLTEIVPLFKIKLLGSSSIAFVPLLVPTQNFGAKSGDFCPKNGKFWPGSDVLSSYSKLG
jgi:hypothetical protein